MKKAIAPAFLFILTVGMISCDWSGETGKAGGAEEIKAHANIAYPNPSRIIVISPRNAVTAPNADKDMSYPREVSPVPAKSSLDHPPIPPRALKRSLHQHRIDDAPK